MDSISCICVSHPSRYGMAQRAILNFLEQDHARRELVIAVTDDGYATQLRSFLRDPRLRQIKLTAPAPVRVISGKFRTPVEAAVQAIAAAEGQWICCWDDDNLSHVARLSRQLKRAGEDLATVFTGAWYFYYDSGELYRTNFIQPAGRASDRCAAGSLFFHRKGFRPIDLATSREPWNIVLLDRLAQNGEYDLITDMNDLFLAGYTGDGVRSEEQHRRRSSLPKTSTAAELKDMSEQLHDTLMGYRFPTSVVPVVGKDAAAFEVSELPTWPEWFDSFSPPEDWQARIPGADFQQRLAEDRRARQQPQP